MFPGAQWFLLMLVLMLVLMFVLGETGRQVWVGHRQRAQPRGENREDP